MSRGKKKKKKQYSQRITCDRKFGIFRWLGVKIHLSVQEIQMMQALSLGQEDLWKEEIATHFKYPSEKAMTPHSSTLAWTIPWTEEPGRLQSMGSRRVGHGWVTSLSLSRFGEGNGNPLQCSCLENPRDGGAWWAAVCGVAQSRTRLKWLSSSKYPCWEKSQGQRNPAGFSSWGRDALDTTEHACTPNLRQHVNYKRIDVITSN